MRIIHLSYNQNNDRNIDPETWLESIRFSIGIWEGLAKHAEVIAFFHMSHELQYSKNGVSYYFTNYTKLQLLFPFGFNSKVKSLEPEVVIVHGLIFPLQIVLLRLQLGKKVKIIAQHHAERPLKNIRKYVQYLADHCIHRYLFCSLELGKQWSDHGLIRNPEKIREIMEASSSFGPMDKERAKTFLKVSGELNFLWIGGLHQRKDPMLAVKAFVRFQRRNPCAQLYMIYQSAEMLEQMKSFIDQAKASDIIHLKGKIEHRYIAYWCNSIDFIVSTSQYEGSGIAVCEAMSCGCIPVLPRIPSFKMMTDNGRVGILFECGDEQGLIDSMQAALNLDRKIERKKILEQFYSNLSFDAITKKMLEVVREN